MRTFPLPPRPDARLCGPRTSQDSTRLWEELPSAVMDVALQLHHSCIRRVSTACSGYESATGELPGVDGGRQCSIHALTV